MFQFSQVTFQGLEVSTVEVSVQRILCLLGEFSAKVLEVLGRLLDLRKVKVLVFVGFCG